MLVLFFDDCVSGGRVFYGLGFACASLVSLDSFSSLPLPFHRSPLG